MRGRGLSCQVVYPLESMRYIIGNEAESRQI